MLKNCSAQNLTNQEDNTYFVSATVNLIYARTFAIKKWNTGISR